MKQLFGVWRAIVFAVARLSGLNSKAAMLQNSLNTRKAERATLIR